MTFETILRSQIARYPAMQIQDLYKLIHQAALGSEHAISSAQAAHKWLKLELAEMGTGPREPMIDPISADGQIVRVHLRPFVEQGGDPERVICIINFGLGAFLGGRSHWQEASQSLGQKNLALVIWIALTFINPLVAMGPMFYILYHHLSNSWSIYQFERRRT